MITFDTEQLFCVDVDNTLLMWGKRNRARYVDDLPEICADFKDPYTGLTITVALHVPNLKVFESRLKRGAKFIVWSQSGWQWAKACMEALGHKDNHNIIVTSKPIGYIDDKPCHLWMGDHINLDMNDAYGVR